ncbi:MAG TPA: hypothetical protein VE153_16375 [Myxococcus sp.]|nr:hypothetical protein [Myxococcus sp.]
MSSGSKLLSVMVLTEDSGEDAYATVHALAKEMLKLLVLGVRTDRVDFKPLADPNARRAMHANLWKSTNRFDQPNITLLIRSIATELLKDAGFVLYHIDGDRRWSQRESSENVREFDRRILQPIKAAIATRFPGSAADERIKRLRLLAPFYSIEAWLYQNTREARQLCTEEGCGSCGPKLDAWEANRASLDEVEQPKEALCLRDKHNARLAASSYPASAVDGAEASFAHAVMGLLECDELTSLLQRTYVQEPPITA